MGFRSFYDDHFADEPQCERALLSAIGFTGAFAACRGITHAIRAGVGPFRNMSVGGRHLHHSTPGIFGLIGIGFLWAQQAYIGRDLPPQWGSRVTATLYGVSAALTLDEFALWMDLSDDYWTPAGRKSIDAVVIFGGLVNIVAIASTVLDDRGVVPAWLKKLGTLDIAHAPGPPLPATADSPPDGGAAAATTD